MNTLGAVEVQLGTAKVPDYQQVCLFAPISNMHFSAALASIKMSWMSLCSLCNFEMPPTKLDCCNFCLVFS